MTTYNGNLNHIKSKDLIMAKDKALPDGSAAAETVNSDSIDLGTGGYRTNIPYVLKASLPAMTTTKTLTVALEDSDDDVTFSENWKRDIEAGTLLAQELAMGVVESKRYLRVSITAEDNLSASKFSACLIPMY